jgi:hypothetical protein
MHYHILIALNSIAATFISLSTISLPPLQILVNYPGKRSSSIANRDKNVANNCPIGLKNSTRIQDRHHSKIVRLVHTLDLNLQNNYLNID